jgi:surfeit locus 1 family protein
MRYSFRPRLLTTLLTLVLFSILLNLGVWQLHRGAAKTSLQKDYTQRKQVWIDASRLNETTQDLRFYKIRLSGKFDNSHNILLDNKIVQHQIGYELYTPFYIIQNQKSIFVDRGFVPQGPSRQILPSIPFIEGEQTIQGILTTPPSSGLKIGAEETFKDVWPLRVSRMDINQLSTRLSHSFYAYVLTQNDSDLSVSTLKPERHQGYAFQWFALAATLLILYIIVSVKKL